MKRKPLSKWLPTPGNILFTLLVAVFLFYTQRANALPGTSSSQTATSSSTTTFPYQGRLTDGDGNPINSTVSMAFHLYNVPSAGTALWSENWPNVTVADGLFNVLLGSTNPISQTVFAENELWLGITVGADDEMTPRAQIGSVPFAAQAFTVDQANLVANVQSIRDTNATHFSVATNNYIDLATLPITVTQPSTLRISFRSLVWKTLGGGRTALGIRVDGNANSAPLVNSLIQVGSPATSGDWWNDSQYLADTFFVNVPSGIHTIALVLGSYDTGTSNATLFGMNVEILKQP